MLNSRANGTPLLPTYVRFSRVGNVPQNRSLEIEALRRELLYGENCVGERISKGLPAEHKVNEKNRSSGDGLEVVGRILIFEDLTPYIVEALGSCLNIDPLFFASHIHASEKALGSQTPELVNLPSRYKHVNFINIHYHRSIVLKGPNHHAGKLKRSCNVPRKLAILPPIKGTQFGLVQHCCSVLKIVDADKRWLGIILVDPPLGDYYLDIHSSAFLPQVRLPSELFLGGYEDFLPPPPFSSDTAIGHGPDRSSLFDDLLYYWATEPPPNFFSQPPPSLMNLSYYPLKIVAAEWAVYLTILHHCIKEYEYRTKQRPNFLEEVERLNTNLAGLQTWRRRALASRHKVDGIIRAISTFQEQNSTDSSIEDEGAISLREDYLHLKTSLSEYAGIMENMLPVLTSLAQIVDSRRSFAETANISRLTILALIFVPLSFLSSLFSMSADYGPGGNLFWVYFAVAVPITIGVFFVARPPTRDLRRLKDFIVRGYREYRQRARWGEEIETPARVRTEASMM